MAANETTTNETGQEQGTPETYKQQLDRIATERRNNQEPQVNPIIEKITEYVPAAAPLLGVKTQKEESPEKEIPGGPPERPHHDTSIEEFVRDQHRSNTEEGLLAGKQ